MAQIAAESLGIPVANVQSKLGDSRLPGGANSGGSQTSASIGPPVRAAALSVRSKAVSLAINDKVSPLYGQAEENIDVENGRFFVKGDTGKGETYKQILARHHLSVLEDEATTNVSTREPAEANRQQGGPEGGEKKKENPAVKADEATDRKSFSFYSFGAHFVKVLVDPELGTVKVDHCVSVMDVGKILNHKTAKNQIMGGMIFGLGMALMEKTEYDHRTGRVVTHDLASYLVPVHADMPTFDVQFIDKPDPVISPIGSRGAGEIGITGFAAAITNAVYHATGRRFRDLPITPDKLL
jgi:xanthine dehydrogenase YagR molybdenum-binding subunit